MLFYPQIQHHRDETNTETTSSADTLPETHDTQRLITGTLAHPTRRAFAEHALAVSELDCLAQRDPSSIMLEHPSSTLPKGAHQRTKSSTTPIDSRSSSLNIWNQDYIDDDHNPYSKESTHSIISPPEPVTLSSSPTKQNIHLPYCEEQTPVQPREPRIHQRSFPNLFPFRHSRATSESPSRKQSTKEELDFEYMPTLTGDTDRVIRVADPSSKGVLSGWFSGTSAPMTVGVPISNHEEMTPPTTPTYTSSPASLSRRPTVARNDTTPSKAASSSTSRLTSFFSAKATPSRQPLPASLADDELLSIDINSLLYPSASDPSLTSSPSAYKNLQQTAEGLLKQLQSAYKARTVEATELRAEHDAQAEELEEERTRVLHLKMQLEEMAKRLVERDEEMELLKQELAHERRTTMKSVRAVAHSRATSGTSGSTGESEDLDVPSRNEDEEEEDDNSTETEDESVFSHDHDGLVSPSLTVISEFSTTSAVSAAEVGKAMTARVVNVQVKNHLASPPPKVVQRRTTLKRLLGAGQREEVNVMGCGRCRESWDTVHLLKAENRGLKDRVGELEGGVEGALDVLAGFHF